jgi:hypothetical protein
MINIEELLPHEELRADFERFKNLSEQEKEKFGETIQQKMQSFSDLQKAEYISAAEKGAQKTLEVADQFIKMVKLQEVSKIISLAYIADKYFGKSRYWLHNKIKNIINGKSVYFTDSEKLQLQKALQDISEILKDTSLNII